MSILRKLSDVIKEVFWIKPSSKKKSTKKRSKKIFRKVVKTPVRKAKPVSKKTKPKIKPLARSVTNQKPVKILAIKKAKVVELDPNLVKVGEITHYFDRIKVCVVKINQGSILIGDKLTIVGEKSKLVQKVWSMQIESQDVKVAKKGQLIGLKIDKPATVGDIVYK